MVCFQSKQEAMEENLMLVADDPGQERSGPVSVVATDKATVVEEICEYSRRFNESFECWEKRRGCILTPRAV